MFIISILIESIFFWGKWGSKKSKLFAEAEI